MITPHNSGNLAKRIAQRLRQNAVDQKPLSKRSGQMSDQSDFEKFKAAAVAELKHRGFSDTEPAMIAVQQAPDMEEVYMGGLYSAAQEIGDNKGWGSEGVGEEAQTMLEAVEKASGVKYEETA